jgi:FlaA1/EpsC-like NDP-sugar epimerase
MPPVRTSLLEKLFFTNPNVRRTFIVLAHFSLWAASFLLALELRFDGTIDPHFQSVVPQALIMLLVVRAITFGYAKLFKGMWRYAGFPELKSIVYATTIGSLGFTLTGLMIPSWHMPRSVYVGEYLASIVFVGGLRLGLRLVRERERGKIRADAIPTLIVGAGDAGESILRDIQRAAATSRWAIVGFLDDNAYKHGSTLRSVPILGAPDETTIRNAVSLRDVALVVLAIPHGDGKRIREILSICQAQKIKTKILPHDRIDGGNLGKIRDIAIEDLLPRDEISLDVEQVANFVADRVVLVTGGGGSIGSELCRQILRFKPTKLLVLDHDENALYEINRELRGAFADLKIPIEPLMGDITDERRIHAIFSKHRPAVVFHAAAHKHVPMMEANPCESVKNNVLGTEMVAKAAAFHNAEAFVLISTDKAVNPTSVMGATKRVAEMILQRIAATSKTRFAAVRFGNVLGSAGSVVPLFKEQIAKGGPITVTHPDVCRYFMTIPEAAQLVMQAGALGGTGEIFVLDMGQPVKIVNLARDLIELSGLRPDVDIAIEFSGLRPGEKLFEELLLDGEAFTKTPHPKIMVGKIQPTAESIFLTAMETLRIRAAHGEEEACRSLLAELVPESTLGKASPPLPENIETAPPRSDTGRPPSAAPKMAAVLRAS